MIIGAADIHEVRARADASSDRLGRDVNVSVLTTEEWATGKTGFIGNLKSKPQVELDLLT